MLCAKPTFETLFLYLVLSPRFKKKKKKISFGVWLLDFIFIFSTI